MRSQCSIPDCTRDLHGRGLCSMHYKRLRAQRDPLMVQRGGPRAASFEERLSRLIAIDDAGCWIWLGKRSWSGYGHVRYGDRSGYLAHRWTWLHMRGPIPDGLQLDHLCRVRACVNPDHLEPVSPAVNTRRAVEAAGLNDRCKRGHFRTEYSTSHNGKRSCRECARALRSPHLPELRHSCPLCGVAMAPQNISRHERRCRASLFGEVPADMHGRRKTYANYRCRCGLCVEAMRAYERQRRVS